MSKVFRGAGTIRVGVIGAGVMGKNHARVLAELPGIELVGVADPDAEAVEFVTSRLGCGGFSTPEALFDAGIDAVTVAAPTDLHLPIARAAIDRRIHVMVEKPIAQSVDEGEKILAAAGESAITLMVGHVERFNPAVQTIKQALKDEEILSIQITRVGPFPPRMSNIGVVIDLAVHDIDLIHWFTMSKIVDIQPQTNSIHAAREDIALLQFRTESGVLAHINTNWLTPFKARTVHVATKNKYISGDLLTRQVTEFFDYKPDGSYSMRHLSVGHAEPLRAELLAFLHAVRTGEPPAVGGADGLASLSIAIRCLADEAASSPANKKRLIGARG